MCIAEKVKHDNFKINFKFLSNKEGSRIFLKEIYKYECKVHHRINIKLLSVSLMSSIEVVNNSAVGFGRRKINNLFM